MHQAGRSGVRPPYSRSPWSITETVGLYIETNEWRLAVKPGRIAPAIEHSSVIGEVF